MIKNKTKIRFDQVEITGIIHEQPEGLIDEDSDQKAIFLGIQLDEELRLVQAREFEVEVFYGTQWIRGKMRPPGAPNYNRTFITILKPKEGESGSGSHH
jgi:hypothetical protein